MPQEHSARGFAAMDPRKQREIASKGGQSVPPKERSFSKDPSLASEAGRKGGQSVPPQSRSFARNPALASEAGRKGAQARAHGANGANGAGNHGHASPDRERREDEEQGPDRRAGVGGTRTQQGAGVERESGAGEQVSQKH